MAAAGEGDEIAGEALALDGDTLMVAGERVLLWGINAPEMGDWPWGPRARGWIDDRLAEVGAVRCVEINRDRYDRPVVVCRAAGADLGEAIIAAGFATRHRLYTLSPPAGLEDRARAYAAAESAARAAGRGVWAAE